MALEDGERGIRTPGRVATTTVFKTAALNHSASSPGGVHFKRAGRRGSTPVGGRGRGGGPHRLSGAALWPSRGGRQALVGIAGGEARRSVRARAGRARGGKGAGVVPIGGRGPLGGPRTAGGRLSWAESGRGTGGAERREARGAGTGRRKMVIGSE